MQISPLSVGIPTFAEQVSQMAALDLIVTVDTTAATLAGALGLPLWIAVPPSLTGAGARTAIALPGSPRRVFRRTGTWRELMNRIARQLAVLAVDLRTPRR
jgi:hypothetical protein